ncbi:hypothetical protein AVEN_71492-1 [Araneus ventricosus]|uniref:Uncharacterized protein n=1 Tax=Araneus ventricosus TaxID=182803 RepID=A0A4Y2FGC9_ARAVE|nr:hypothetical protein AVEN_71492-1 [Araneus ventricosus]
MLIILGLACKPERLLLLFGRSISFDQSLEVCCSGTGEKWHLLSFQLHLKEELLLNKNQGSYDNDPVEHQLDEKAEDQLCPPPTQHFYSVQSLHK